MRKTKKVAPKRKANRKVNRKPAPVPIAGALLQRALVNQLSFHARRISDALECGASGTEFFEIAARNCANAFERILLDSMLKDQSAAPLAYLVDSLTGFPRSKR